MNSWADGTAFVERVRRSFGQHYTLYHLLQDASRSGIFLRGNVDLSEDGSITVYVGDPGIVGRGGRHRVRIRIEPVPHMHCDCRAGGSEEHCRHMCWLLLRGGQLTTTPRSNDHFWHEGIIATHARLLPLATPLGSLDRAPHMNRRTDVTDFLADVRSSFGPDRHRMLHDAAISGIFMTGDDILESEDGCVRVEVAEPGIVGIPGRHRVLRHRVLLRTEPVPGMDCDCSTRRVGQHCRHMSWLLLLGGQLDTSVHDYDEFYDTSVVALHAMLLASAARPPMETPPRPTREEASPPDPTADCPICYEPFREAACVRCSACPAHFHRSCAARWGKSCPMCRDPHQFADLRDPTCTDQEPVDFVSPISVPPVRTPLSEASEARARSLRAVADRFDGWDAAMANLVRAQLQAVPDPFSPPRPPSPPSSTQQPIASQRSSTV